MQKEKIRMIFVVGMMVLMTTASAIYAISRHTKDQAPVRYSVTIAEGAVLSKTISCYDPDGDTVTLTAEDLPVGAAVAPQVTQAAGYTDATLPPVAADAPNAKWYTRVLTWTPNYQQAGTYIIYVHAVDANGDDDWVKYEIIVTNTNRPPVL